MSTQTQLKNRQFKLKARPIGKVTKENFEYVEELVPELGQGEVLVKTIYLSLDPTNRIWMSDMEQYMPPVQLGEVMRGLGLGKVIASNNSNFKVGDTVSGLLGWQDYYVMKDSSIFPLSVLPNIPGMPLTVLAGAAGMTGWTAYFGLFELGTPKAGETIVVSAAAGAVGSIVGQIAKIKGLKVVGIAGGEAKCKWLLDELGFDRAVDYKNPNWKEQLKAATPDGVDINFENVGGEIMQEVYQRMNLHGRMVLCGFISGYNDTDNSKTMLDISASLMKRIRIEGFIVTDFAAKIPEATQNIVKWIAEGKIKHRETIVDGLENAPETLNLLFEGGNTGKLLIKVADA